MQHKKLNEPTAKQSQMIQDAVALHQSGQLDAAEIQYKKLLKLLPSNTGLLSNLGIMALQKGLFEDAVRILGRSLQIHPKQPSALNNYGIALQDLKRWDEALVSYDSAIALKPDFSDAYYNRGLILQELNRLDEALANYDKAIILKPNYVVAYYNRGNVLKDLNRLDEALGSYESAIAFKLDHANAYSNRGNVLKDLNRLDEALLSYKRAMVINPDIDYILGFTLYTKMQLCIWDERPKHLNNLIYKINNDEKVEEPFPMLAFIDDPELHRKTAKIFANKKYHVSHLLPKIQRYPQHEKIRVGYFSADFRNHPVAMLTAELYETHDRNHFEIYAFSLGPDTQDDMNLRIKAGVDHFYDVRTLLDKDITMLARNVEIDIAVDLGGYTTGARPGIFAMQVAPIQVSYLGYPSTMAVVYIDYLIADRTLIPDHQQQHYSEKIVYLPNSYMVNDTKNKRSTRVFTRAEAGLPNNGFVFCCFNNHFKITPTVFMSWMRILLQVEGSVLWLPEGNHMAVANLKKEAVKMGVNEHRLVFAPRLASMDDHFKRIQLADLFIDTLPYNAHTTASDALRMGLPVLTCIGQSFASRVAASLLKAVNMPELITTTQEHYEALAIELATHPEKLTLIKAQLVANLTTAPLYDTALFTKHLESAYLTMYERYQNGLAPEHIVVEHYHNKAIAVHEDIFHLQNKGKPMPIVDQELQESNAQATVEQATRMAYVKALSEAGNMKINAVIIEHDDRELLFNYREDSIADNGVIKQVFQDNAYDIAHWEQGKKLIEYHNQQSKIRPSLIIDAGANIGASAVYFSINYPSSFVFSLEPDTTNWHLLEINTIGLNVFNFNGAIADVDGELALVDPGQSDWGFMTTAIPAENQQDIIKVKSISPLSILSHPATQNLNPLILKIDIEGGEDYLFKGDTHWLKNFPLIIIELHDWMLPFSGSSRNFIKAIAEHDFDFVHRGEKIFLFNRQILGS